MFSSTHSPHNWTRASNQLLIPAAFLGHSPFFLSFLSVTQAHSLWPIFQAEEDNHQSMALLMSPDFGDSTTVPAAPQRHPPSSGCGHQNWRGSFDVSLCCSLDCILAWPHWQPSHWGSTTGPVGECLPCLYPWSQDTGWYARIPSVYMERVGCSELCAVAIRRMSRAGGTVQGGEGSQWCPGVLLSGPIKSLAAGHWAREHRLARPNLDATRESNEFKFSCWHQSPALYGNRVLCFLSLTWLL